LLEHSDRGDFQRMQGRRARGIPDDRVCSIALPELVEQAVIRAAQTVRIDARSATYLKNEIFDWWTARQYLETCHLFHGFEQCALFSLKRAHGLGAVTVLDQPIMHRASLDRIEREERTILRAPPMDQKKPFWFDQHVERKYKEHEVSDYVFAGLEFVKRTMVENGFPSERIYVIPYGVDTDDFPYVDRPARSGFNVLYVGPVHFWKGLHYLLEAMEGLDVPGATLTIVGGVHPEWGAVFEPRFAKLGNRVRRTGPIAHAEMMRHYAEADVLAFPSLVGGIGLCCYEAMATGLPVITSEGDVVIRDGVDGICVPYNDVAGWRRAFVELAGDRERRVALGQRGAQRVKAFTVDAYRASILAAYEDIAARVIEGRHQSRGTQC
jgi:glycosyltransferase involved in cell wall biosynthesis